jgi:phage terminase small subunit
MLPEDRMTDKQEKFCQNYINGMSPLESALDAGYKESSAGVIGSVLLNNVKVKRRIAELKEIVNEPILAKLIITRESQIQDLEKIKMLCMDSGQFKTAINAITEENKLLGLYEAEKKDISINTIPYQINISGTIIE